MDHQLKLTAKGYAICELMADLGLTLEAACAHVDREVEALRQRVESILADSAWEDLPGAMQVALAGVSAHVQSAYLEQTARSSVAPSPASVVRHDGASVH